MLKTCKRHSSKIGASFTDDAVIFNKMQFSVKAFNRLKRNVTEHEKLNQQRNRKRNYQPAAFSLLKCRLSV